MSVKTKVEPISVQAHFKEDGTIEPLKFNYKGKDYRVAELVETRIDNWAGNKLRVFKYKANKTVFELRYELDSMKWTIKFVGQ